MSYADLGGQPSTARLPSAVVMVIPEHTCNHVDRHTCPWVDLPEGGIARCDCPTVPRGSKG